MTAAGLRQLVRQRRDPALPGLHGLVDQPQRLLEHRAPAGGVGFQQYGGEQYVRQDAQRGRPARAAPGPTKRMKG